MRQITLAVELLELFPIYKVQFKDCCQVGYTSMTSVPRNNQLFLQTSNFLVTEIDLPTDLIKVMVSFCQSSNAVRHAVLQRFQKSSLV